MEIAFGLGLFASFVTVVAYLPQVIKSWKTRDTSALSFRTFATFCIASALWIVYGVLQRDVAVIGTNTILLVFQLSLIYLMLREKRA